MAQLVLGVAGAVVGGMIGGPIGASIGWAAGAALGGLVDPPKSTGPRLTDLKLQSSQYGSMIPLVYGTERITGQVIWQTDLTEHEKKQGGKGGGPTVTTYTYSASFAVLLCAGPIVDVIKVWADGRLVFDKTVNTAQFPFTLYLGDETQTADPTMEAALGAGNVPGYRGYAYMVFEDLDLTPYGNRIPNLSMLVITASSPILKRLATWVPWGYDPAYNQTTTPGIAYDGEKITRGLMVGDNPIGGAFGWTWGASTYGVEDARFSYQWSWYTEQGNLIGYRVDSTVHEDDAVKHVYLGRAYHCKNIPGLAWHQINEGAYLRHPPSTRIGWGRMFYGSSCVSQADADPYICVNLFVADWTGHWGYFLGQSDGVGGGGNALLRKAALPAGTGTVYVYTIAAPGSADQYEVNIDTDGTLWVVGYANIWHLRDTGTAFELIHHYDTNYPNNPETARGGAMFCNGTMIEVGWLNNNAGSGIYAFNSYTITDTLPWTLDASIQYGNGGEQPGTLTKEIWPLSPGSGLAWVQDGLISACGRIGAPTDLATIVADLSVRSGLTAAQFDVSELTDIVDGYVISQQMTTRSAIESLMAAYFFDAVESDGIVKFPKRGGASVQTVPAADLGAHEWGGGDPPSAISRQRAQETDLPRLVNVVYSDYELDYQNGEQLSQRMTGNAVNAVTISLAIAMQVDKAKQIADTQLFIAWMERDKASIKLPRKYAFLDPTDPITVSGGLYRITERTEAPYQAIDCKLVRAGTVDMFEATAVGAPAAFGVPIAPGGGIGNGPGDTDPGEITLHQMTQMEILDIPYLAGSSDPGSYHIALQGADRRTWAGAVVFDSLDTGSTYNEVLTGTSPDTIGQATSVLGDYPGGNTFDEANYVDVVLGKGAGELESISANLVLNGRNLASLGDEIIQFRDAELTAERTYRLTGLLRGRRGTEWAMATHASAERFVMLPVNARSPIVPSEIGVNAIWKAVSAGNTLALAPDIHFMGQANALRPLSPVHLGTGINGAGDYLLTWTRRTRADAAWLDYVDVPVMEATEQYRILYYSDNTFATVVGFTDGIMTTGYTLTVARQTELYGAPQAPFWTVAQIGAVGAGYESSGNV